MIVGALINAVVVVWIGQIDCPPGARLVGEPGLVADVAARLESRGLVLQADGCPLLLVELERSGAGLIVRAGDDGAIIRRAEDAEGVATVIESFARPDLTEPLLTRALARFERRPVAPLAEPKSEAASAAPVVAPEPRPFTVGIGGVVGMADDGSTWSGFDLRGCVQIGWVCFEARVQYALDLETGGASRALDGSRSLLDFALGAHWPLVFDDLEISPGLGLGASVLRTSRVIDGQVADDDAGGVRGRAEIAASARLARNLSLHIQVAADWAPFADPRLFDTLGGDAGPNVLLPGEPELVGWLRAGLELGEQ